MSCARRRDGPKGFLAGGVPDLQLDRLAIYFHLPLQHSERSPKTTISCKAAARAANAQNPQPSGVLAVDQKHRIIYEAHLPNA